MAKLGVHAGAQSGIFGRGGGGGGGVRGRGGTDGGHAKNNYK